ncbi:XRI1-like protein [Trema orientale]|uniref:XRI1-like protein n=1 Tax=Trema orientale TaxID=63057 RepID=A0A2P5CDA3_TREOI|nr:XRI1-like protein [Trema orientale]
MSELHLPMSFYTNNNNNRSSSLHNSSLGWDHHNYNFHSLGVLNTETMSLGSEEDDFSTGYLEDALVEFSERSKRRRLLLCSDDQETIMRDDHYYSNLLSNKSYWNSSSISNWEMSHENFSFMSQMNTDFNEVLSGGPMTTSICSIAEEANLVDTEMKTPEEEKSFSGTLDSSSSSSYKDSANTKSLSDKENLFSLDPSGKKKKRAAVITRVVYPFAVVKPGGREGDVTLNDINERILMPPTRPVRHPVGDFACRPCVSPHGPGLSGKAVVALTRIQTQGRGTITIIRTKG